MTSLKEEREESDADELEHESGESDKSSSSSDSTDGSDTDDSSGELKFTFTIYSSVVYFILCFIYLTLGRWKFQVIFTILSTTYVLLEEYKKKKKTEFFENHLSILLNFFQSTQSSFKLGRYYLFVWVDLNNSAF